MIEAVSKFVPKSNIVATTNCGMAPMRRDIAEAKLPRSAPARNWRGRSWVKTHRAERGVTKWPPDLKLCIRCW